MARSDGSRALGAARGRNRCQSRLLQCRQAVRVRCRSACASPAGAEQAIQRFTALVILVDAVVRHRNRPGKHNKRNTLLLRVHESVLRLQKSLLRVQKKAQ